MGLLQTSDNKYVQEHPVVYEVCQLMLNCLDRLVKLLSLSYYQTFVRQFNLSDVKRFPL